MTKFDNLKSGTKLRTIPVCGRFSMICGQEIFNGESTSHQNWSNLTFVEETEFTFTSTEGVYVHVSFEKSRDGQMHKYVGFFNKFYLGKHFEIVQD